MMSSKAVFSRLILFLLFSVVLFGNGLAEEIPPEKAEAARKSQKSVTDSWGRRVVLPGSVEKIACLYAFSGHVTTMLGRGDDIVAVVPGLKRDKILNQLNPALNRAVACTSDGVINIEELLKTDPDLIFLKGESARLEAEVEKLNRFQLPYIVIEYNSIEEQMQAIEIIAEALGREEKGREYNTFYLDTINKTESALASLPDSRKRRVYHSVNEAVRTDAPGTLPAEWLKIAGVTNVSLDKRLKFRDNKYFASLEQIYLWNPEVIIANEGGVDKYMLGNEKWAGLQAVKEKKVYQIPIGISRWGHPGGMETPLAILWTVDTLYPGYRKDLDLDREIRRFYKRFFGFEVNDEMLAAMKSGNKMRIPKGDVK